MLFASKNFIFSINPIQFDDYFSYIVKNNRTIINENNENNENAEDEVFVDNELFEMLQKFNKIKKKPSLAQLPILNDISENLFEDRSRNFLKEYISLINFNKEYQNTVKIKDFVKFILAKEDADFKLSLYSYFYVQGFNVVSGKNYGLDYILYKKEDKEHTHGQYLVEVLNKKEKFFQVVGKIRVSNNYGKKLVLLQAKNEENIIEPFNIHNLTASYKFKSLILKKSDI